MLKRMLAALLLFPLFAAAGASAETDPVIRVIYNNVVDVEGYEGAWGFSCVVEGLEKTILFDTGLDGEILMRNMERAGVDPRSIDIVVLSHYHNDHTGGLGKFLEKNDGVMVFVPDSFPDQFKKGLRDEGIRLVEVKSPLTVCRDAFTTGGIDGPVVEQSLVIKTTRGSLLITGCAHPGIKKIVEEATDLSGRQVFFAMGGFHLLQMDAEAMTSLIESLHDLGVIYCGASHCTGDEQIRAIREAYGDRYVDIGAGAVIDASEFAWRPSSRGVEEEDDR